MAERAPRASRAHRIGAAFVFVTTAAIGFIPLFGGPGYEHALACGLIVPSTAAICVALAMSRARNISALETLGRGIAIGLAYAVIALGTALLHALRVGACDPLSGILYFGMTAAFGAAMGGAWGAVVSEVARRRRRRKSVAVLLALAAPIACVAISVGRYLTSPMIFAFDPFAGYFSGVLYDTIIDPGVALYTYRLGSLSTLVALVLVASVLARTDAGKLRVSLGDGGARARLGLGVLCAIVSLSITARGSPLGHWSTPATIEEALGARKSGAHCDVVYPSTTRDAEGALLLRDCEENLVQVQHRLGATGPAHITAYFFRDADEKKRLMGAAHTYIAKPWREEVYLQLSGYPHPVLGHEIAHVVAGSFARGPFRVAGPAGGFWPNPGLIEGVAVAASPDDDVVTDAEWARAMMDLKILPPIERVFSMDFLGDSAQKSYTIAGAFVTWVLARYGDGAVRAWYGGASIEELTGKSWSDLDKDFRAYLSTVVMSEEAASFAQAKFERPGIFGRVCPHVVDELKRDAEICRGAQKYTRAIETYREVLTKDPNDWSSKVALGSLETRWGDEKSGQKELETLANEKSVPRTWRDHAAEAIADGDLLNGRYDEAAARYRFIAAASLDEDFARNLEVKAIGAEDPLARPAVLALLTGDKTDPPDVFLAGVDLGAWGKTEANGALVDYLIGRNLAQHGLWGKGYVYLAAADANGHFPTPRVARESFRQLAIAACATEDTTRISSLHDRATGADGKSLFAGEEGRLDWTVRLLERCAIHLKN